MRRRKALYIQWAVFTEIAREKRSGEKEQARQTTPLPSHNGNHPHSSPRRCTQPRVRRRGLRLLRGFGEMDVLAAGRARSSE